MKKLREVMEKQPRLVIGLMSGTSADGMDAALTEITGWGPDTRVRQLAFITLPYSEELRSAILHLASGSCGGTHELSLFSFLLGEVSLEACFEVCRAAGADPADVDLVGSHGQTLWHIPVAEPYLGRMIRATLQCWEASVIAEGLGCPVVSDFRVRDMAAGGNGAPLVPYTEYLLYRSETENIGLQNIGGIGNVTILPAGCTLEDTFAFDTGPGNMVIDQLAERMTAGRHHYDENGRIAASGSVSEALLRWMLDNPYLRRKPPKTTGREMYGREYVDRLCAQAKLLHVSDADTVATATCYTAECIRIAADEVCPVKPDRLIVGGGGCRNPVMMAHIRRLLSIPVQTNEETGRDSDAKEAVAFAVLANECVSGIANNVPPATGASHPVVMGKITQ